jgi:hypothetical protein
LTGTKAVEPPQVVTFETILPATLAVRAEEIGVRKATSDPVAVSC